MQHSIEDFIGVFDGAYEAGFCNDIINMFEQHDKLGFTHTRELQGQPKNLMDDKQLMSADLPFDNFTQKMFNHFVSRFHQTFAYYNREYEAAFNAASPFGLYGPKVQRTSPGQGYHVWHFEASDRHVGHRFMAYILYLNDVQDGGETEFLYQKKRVHPQQGRLVVFPASFTHTHRGNPPLSGDKYILTGWLEF